MQCSQKLHSISHPPYPKREANTYISNLRIRTMSRNTNFCPRHVHLDSIFQLNSNQHIRIKTIGLKKKKKKGTNTRSSKHSPNRGWNRLVHRHERAPSATWNVEPVPRKDRNRKMRYDKCSVLSMTKPRRRNEHGREMWHTPRPRHYWTSPMANLVNGSRQPSLNFG